jgi:hypothetical protein
VSPGSDTLYGTQVQQARRDQFVHDSAPPQLDPDARF